MLLEERTLDRLTRIAPKLIYGTIIVYALIGSLSNPLPRSPRVVLTVFLSLLGVSVANAYAQRIHEEMATRSVTPWRRRWRSILKPSWVMTSAAVPITSFGFATLGWIGPETALTATQVGLFVLLVLFGFVARRMSGGRILASILTGAALGLFGHVIGQIKVWTKYLPTL